MKTKASMVPDQPEQNPSTLFPARRITRLLLDLKARLGQTDGQLSYDDWARITGRPANTIASWCAGGAAHQLEVLLASMERLTEPERHQLIDRTCRDYPTLGHSKLAHDFVACSRLATLLRQPSGLTFIQGGPEHMRTFVVSALGHSAGDPNTKRATVAGVDIHRPDALVPVIGVTYLDNPLCPADIERQFNRFWPSVLAKGSRLILLNDVWRAIPALHREIMETANNAHVVVADVAALKPGDLTIGVSAPVHLVTVSPARERTEWIRVEIQAA